MKTKEVFTLEFNEDQQAFHLNDGSNLTNTLGWRTVLENCTPLLAEKITNTVDKELPKPMTLTSILEFLGR